EPSSRTALMGEQPNPWDRLQPQEAMSRHRGAKPPRRCERVGEMSLLAPRQLVSVERWPVDAEPPDHSVRLSSLLDLSVSQSSSLLPLHSVRMISNHSEGTSERLRYSLGGDRPSQTANLTLSPNRLTVLG